MGGRKTNRLREFIRKTFKAVRTWQLILIFIPLVFFTATLLRFDHLRMADLRSKVFAADEAGDEAEIERTLTELRNFVYSHTVINVAENNGVSGIVFGTGPFYLEQQYIRAANAAIDAASNQLVDDSNPNGNIYAAVAAICQPQAIANGWAWSDQPYLDCWTSELAKYPESDNLDTNLTAKVPSTELFRYNYASPLFSWTPASIAVIACVVLAVIILIRIVIWCILQLALLFLK